MHTSNEGTPIKNSIFVYSSKATDIDESELRFTEGTDGFNSKIDLREAVQYLIDKDAFSEADDKKALEASLSLGQIELLPKYLAYHDLSLSDAVTASDYVASSKIYDKFKVLASSFNNNVTGSSNNGRPSKSEDEIDNDNTAASVDSGQNTSEVRETSTTTTSTTTSNFDLTEGDEDEV